MSLQLQQGEIVLFSLATFASFFDCQLPTWRMPAGQLHAQGSLWLTNLRLVFRGDYQTRKTYMFNRKKRFYNHYEKDASFEMPVTEILDMKLCKIGGVWPTGLEVSFASGRTIIFSLFGRKKLYDAFHTQCKAQPSIYNKAAYSFEEIEKLLQQSIKNGYEAELTIYINDREYMIIIYDDHCSFQRCSHNNGSGEYSFKSLDELYSAEQIDGIILKRDWEKISRFDCSEFDIQDLW